MLTEPAVPMDPMTSCIWPWHLGLAHVGLLHDTPSPDGSDNSLVILEAEAATPGSGTPSPDDSDTPSPDTLVDVPQPATVCLDNEADTQGNRTTTCQLDSI